MNKQGEEAWPCLQEEGGESSQEQVQVQQCKSSKSQQPFDRRQSRQVSLRCQSQSQPQPQSKNQQTAIIVGQIRRHFGKLQLLVTATVELILSTQSNIKGLLQNSRVKGQSYWRGLRGVESLWEKGQQIKEVINLIESSICGVVEQFQKKKKLQEILHNLQNSNTLLTNKNQHLSLLLQSTAHQRDFVLSEFKAFRDSVSLSQFAKVLKKESGKECCKSSSMKFFGRLLGEQVQEQGQSKQQKKESESSKEGQKKRGAQSRKLRREKEKVVSLNLKKQGSSKSKVRTNITRIFKHKSSSTLFVPASQKNIRLQTHSRTLFHKNTHSYTLPLSSVTPGQEMAQLKKAFLISQTGALFIYKTLKNIQNPSDSLLFFRQTLRQQGYKGLREQLRKFVGIHEKCEQGKLCRHLLQFLRQIDSRAELQDLLQASPFSRYNK